MLIKFAFNKAHRSCTCITSTVTIHVALQIYIYTCITSAYVLCVSQLIKETQRQFPSPSMAARRAPGKRSRPARRVNLHGGTDGYWRRRA